MKNIDDKMIEEALRNLKRIRKFEPFLAVLGLAMLVLAGLLSRATYLYVQTPFPDDSHAEVALRVSLWIQNVGWTFAAGVIFVCLGLFRNRKDIILECLAEQYLNDKKEPDEEPG